MEEIVNKQGRRGVLVSSGYQNTIDYLTSAAAVYFFLVLEAPSPRSRHQQGWFLLRPLTGLQTASSLPRPHTVLLCVHLGASGCVQPSCSSKDTSPISTDPNSFVLT